MAISEYQYYEFQAIDRPLTDLERQKLRALSTRARITAKSFVCSYEQGDFKGSPAGLTECCFDLHLYLAHWGSRCFFMRLSAQQRHQHGPQRQLPAQRNGFISNRRL